MFPEKKAKRNSLFAIYFILVTLLNVLMSGCYTLSPRAKEMLSLGDGDASGVPKLIEGLSDKDPDVRLAALKSIIKLGPQVKDTLPTLIKLLTSPSSRDYYFPVGFKPTPGSQMLGYYEHQGIKMWFTREGIGRVEFQDIRPKDKGMQSWLIVALGPIEYPIVGFGEVTLSRVIEAIGAIGPAAESAIPEIALFLHDTQSWTGKMAYGHIVVSYYDLRLAAAEALGNIGPAAKQALPDLEWALQDEKKRLDLGYGEQEAYDIIKKAISKVEAR